MKHGKLEESIDVINNQAEQSMPKKTLINTAIKGMQAIKGGVEFLAAIGALAQFVQAL